MLTVCQKSVCDWALHPEGLLHWVYAVHFLRTKILLVAMKMLRQFIKQLASLMLRSLWTEFAVLSYT